ARITREASKRGSFMGVSPLKISSWPRKNGKNLFQPRKHTKSTKIFIAAADSHAARAYCLDSVWFRGFRGFRGQLLLTVFVAENQISGAAGG
ncbi:MAG: hypothetical protein KA757_11890, partial [Vogesella sp.]|nr:hypothetical protein [Vogesella sp.]